MLRLLHGWSTLCVAWREEPPGATHLDAPLDSLPRGVLHTGPSQPTAPIRGMATVGREWDGNARPKMPADEREVVLPGLCVVRRAGASGA